MRRTRLAAGFFGAAMMAVAASAMANGVDGTGQVGTCPTAGKGLKKISFGSKPSKDDLQEGSGTVTIN